MTTPVTEPAPLLARIGEPVSLGDITVTVLSVEDPFPPTPQLEPKPDHRWVSLRYELTGESLSDASPSDLPAVELLDSTGRRYQSEHGRVGFVGGSGTPGGRQGGTTVDSSALFEIPHSVTGLVATFRVPRAPGPAEVLVALD